MTRDYLTELLNTYWFAPPVALWRAVELRTAAEETYARPLLDLGCGDGLIARVLFGKPSPPAPLPGGEGEIVDVGLDPWPEQLRQAAQSGMYRHVDLARGNRMPYPSGAFATVFSNSVLEHIPDPQPVVREAGRVLRQGGHFTFTVPSDAFRTLLDGYARRMAAGDAAGAEAYARSADRWLAHHHYHTPDEWRDILATAGMTLVTARYYVPQPVARLWDRMNRRYGIGQRSVWSVLVSPRFQALGYQVILRRLVMRNLSRRWRAYYEMDVPVGEKGGGLLVVGQRTSR